MRSSSSLVPILFGPFMACSSAVSTLQSTVAHSSVGAPTQDPAAGTANATAPSPVTPSSDACPTPPRSVERSEVGEDRDASSAVEVGGGGFGEGIALSQVTGGRSSGVGGTPGKPLSVEVGAFTVSEGLPLDVIQRVVRGRLNYFRLCYANGLKDAPKAQGTISLTLNIQSDGAVGDVGESGSLTDPPTLACFRRAVAGLSFPAPDGGKAKVAFVLSLAQ